MVLGHGLEAMVGVVGGRDVYVCVWGGRGGVYVCGDGGGGGAGGGGRGGGWGGARGGGGVLQGSDRQTMDGEVFCLTCLYPYGSGAAAFLTK